MERQLGLSKLFILLWVSTVERCPLSRVPLYSNGCRVTPKLCLLCEKGKTSSTFSDSMCPWLHLLNWKLHPSTPAPVPASKQAPLLSPKNNVQRQQSEMKDHRPWNFGINGKNCVSRSSGWHYHCLHCSHHNLNVSIHDGICLRLSLSVATNYSCFHQH